MNLTSLNRVKNALGVTGTDSDAVLSRLVSTASNRIAFFLRREDAIELKSRTEYFNPYLGQRTFYTKAYPITVTTSLHTDSYGTYTGNQQIIDPSNYIVGADGRTIWLQNFTSINNPLLTPYPGRVYPKSVRLIYTAGLAADPVVSSWTKTADAGGSLTAGYFIQGALSGAVGKLTAAASGSLSYENIYGAFAAGEAITEFKSLDNSLSQGNGANDASGVTASLIACTAQSLAEGYPDLTEGCEMYVRYLWKNRDNFGNIMVTRDGETRTSRSDNKNDSSLTPEVREIVDTYRNRYFG